ncbi:transposase [Xiamenia xianingshaonis]|uniref:Transposase n=1 Tax=Xiamenia xianingshaonis TaxID=2682776 RepID=A0A9E6MPL0_9ACTN|nr:transposase [Xiamenia xianingshaonis]QTU83743.1 transposase [Xiamenia xianingshaonis]
MKTELREWALDPAGWRLSGSDAVYDLREAGEVETWERVLHKEKRAKDDEGFERRCVATFSFKRMEYRASMCERQAERAAAKAAKGAKAAERRSPNDPARLLCVEHVTAEGELADRAVASLDESKVAEEARCDGLSCIATSLEDDPADVIAVNKRRWRIEECFRTMKAELKARPACLSRADGIRGHFLTCFVALLVYRLMDERLGHKFTCGELLSTLRGMDVLELSGEGWVPAYARDDVTDALHDAFGFRTDYEIVANRQMGKVLTAAHGAKVRSTKR